MDKLSKALNDFQNWLKGNGNKVATKENTRRAVLTRFGFIIESDMEVEDHPEFLKKKSDIESRSNEMATRHDKEVWTYIAQGFPGSKERPSAEMVGQRLKTNPDFRSGLLKLQDRHKTEYAALKGELKSAVEDNEIYKQEARSEQVRSMTTEQKRELVGEKSRARYQTEEGKLDRQYRNINHYGRQGERIKEVQRTRYQEDEDFRTKQIERSRARLQKPGIKELGAAEARERTRLRNNPLNEQCDCGCNGNLKTHRANFRKKFWSEYNPVKEGGFKILIAGIDNDAYWNGESWRRCIISAYRIPTDDSWIPKEKNSEGKKWKKGVHKPSGLPGAFDPDGNFHPRPGPHNLPELSKDENYIRNSTANAIRWHNIYTLKLPWTTPDSAGNKKPKTSIGGNLEDTIFPTTRDEYGLVHPHPDEPNRSTNAKNKVNTIVEKKRILIRGVYKLLGKEPCSCCSHKREHADLNTYNEKHKNGKLVDFDVYEAQKPKEETLKANTRGDTGRISIFDFPSIKNKFWEVMRNRDPEGKLKCQHKNPDGTMCGKELFEPDHPNSNGVNTAQIEHIDQFAPIAHGLQDHEKGSLKTVSKLAAPFCIGHSKAKSMKEQTDASIDSKRMREPVGQNDVHQVLKEQGLHDIAKNWLSARTKKINKHNAKLKRNKDISQGLKPKGLHPNKDPQYEFTNEEKQAHSIGRTILESLNFPDTSKRKSARKHLISPEPTGKPITRNDYNWDFLLSRGVRKPQPTKTRVRNGKTEYFEGEKTYGYTDALTGESSNTQYKKNRSLFKTAKQALNVRKFNDLIANRRASDTTGAYEQFDKFQQNRSKSSRVRKPGVIYTCEHCGHDEVTYAREHQTLSNPATFIVDHDTKEHRDYDPKGEWAEPDARASMVCPDCDGHSDDFRRKHRTNWISQGIRPKTRAFNTKMKNTVLNYRNSRKSYFSKRGGFDVNRPVIEDKWDNEQNVKASSWNGFKALNNL